MGGRALAMDVDVVPLEALNEMRSMMQPTSEASQSNSQGSSGAGLEVSAAYAPPNCQASRGKQLPGRQEQRLDLRRPAVTRGCAAAGLTSPATRPESFQ